ncbi:hypothetical protein PoB_002605500 [Plakobranchus ocellatus]|uniref:Uncharacterized protein n=1 Tax=Plakobranchus ocellatus TaxID=259542 RepID=A0AAV3ZY07_9GAST|nr:hypothetical protein PoB_002605500 [Plakobranchus ocellatus]
MEKYITTRKVLCLSMASTRDSPTSSPWAKLLCLLWWGRAPRIFFYSIHFAPKLTACTEPSQEKHCSELQTCVRAIDELRRTSIEIGLNSFLRKNDQPIGQQRSALLPRLGKK